ncbi:thiamine pyrophosphate-dependent enzyme [Nonomuraea sp. NEAU-A123]|uniref:thiamine pyrophosphate-dependent enzyme n=1 Tax=Nonomuraea sp. NEAU-A123 TaxID=2839649 RepID=UPI001BE3E017|nr:thiamine pyrophosphate-dependent enzyme [Nonomuraea sp. NEAU-A123]MBT2224430.1 thiamine pyrophosphate-binding protein [Nonomuraea sp. NEAU-A123]
MSTVTVREATFEVLRRFGLTTIFCNPGSTEVALLTGLPDDLRFVLALHEGSVVGMATGWAIGHRAPALAVLHTAAGLGNAVGAIATARANRVPLVILVGQQDRRHLALEPFLTGWLAGLAGDYPVRVDEPARPQDVPGAVARAYHEAVTFRGPALVVVPMDDWAAPFEDETIAAPARLLRPASVPDESLAPLVDLLSGARSPAIVAGAGTATAGTAGVSGDGALSADSGGREAGWAAVVALAERLGCPVWQESFGAMAGFPQDHPQYAGVLPADRTRLRAALAGHDVVLAVGAPVFRQYPFDTGPLVEPGTTVALVTDDPAEAHRSPADLAYLAAPSAVCEHLAVLVPARSAPVRPTPAGPALPLADDGLRAAHVLHELARRLPADAVLVEETPSSRPDLHRLVPARNPLGFVSAAMGGLGFGLPAAVGLRMSLPDRPVVAVVGDGSALYGVHALWSAAHYRVGALFVVLANGRYAVMDRLADKAGGKAPWPAFTEVSIGGMARSLGCAARRVDTAEELAAVLDEVVPTLAAREEPLLLDVTVAVDPDFQP